MPSKPLDSSSRAIDAQTPKSELYRTIAANTDAGRIGAAKSELDRREREWQSQMLDRQMNIADKQAQVAKLATWIAAIAAFSALASAIVSVTKALY